MDIIKALQEELNIGRNQVEAAVKLIDEGNTIPFIARYRKEATGSLDDEVLRNLDERLRYLRNLEEKKTQVVATIREQGKLTRELEEQIAQAQTLVAVEDLYRPYRPKRRTRAAIAQEKGLTPLADMIMLQVMTEPVEKAAEGFISEEKGVKTVKEAIDGAKDILAERFPTAQITGLISVILPGIWEPFSQRPGTRRQNLSTRCITSTKSRSKRQQDTGFWR